MPRHPSAGTAAESSHLSIGEVLGLLLEEFPDVTISKIRFLESQGLIAPERTPSGYRKFFDDDVELLRVILREQRENYLPLRVIKDRISSGELDPSGENTIPRGIRNVSDVGGSGDERSDDDTQPAGIPRTIGSERTRREEPERPEPSSDTRDHAVLDTAPIPTIGPSGRAERPAAPAAPAAEPESPLDERADDECDSIAEPAREPEAASTDAGTPAQPTSEAGDAAHEPSNGPVPSAGDAGSTRSPPEPSDTASASSPDPGKAGEPERASAPPESSPPSESAGPAPPEHRATPDTPPAGEPPPASSGASTSSPDAPASSHPHLLPGVTLTVDELSAMVGATPAEIGQLEEYGIVAGRESAGEHVYDEDAVTVARIAVEFLHLGIDARHLRGWKTAADREAGIFEQLIMPLLRQRNPQGRQQASQQLQRMNELGAQLRAALMNIALRDVDRG